MDVRSKLALDVVNELAGEIAKATPHDQAIAKLLAMIDQYFPDSRPPIGSIQSWEEFERFWKSWYPDGLMKLNMERPSYKNDPDRLPPDAYASLIRRAFLEATHSFLEDLQVNRQETLKQLSDYPWALEPPPKRGFFRKLFG